MGQLLSFCIERNKDAENLSFCTDSCDNSTYKFTCINVSLSDVEKSQELISNPEEN
jgi:hypothetical protein